MAQRESLRPSDRDAVTSLEREARLKAYLAFDLDSSALANVLNSASKEQSSPLITLPLPDGNFSTFRFVESPVMPPELAAQFPEIRTFSGQSVDDPAITVRFDSSPSGFHAQILSPDGASYIEPCARGNRRLHVSYFKKDYRSEAKQFQCFTPQESAASRDDSRSAKAAAVPGGNLRTYRIACAATAEYTAYFGGTVADGLAAIVSAVNRVSGIYETELGIRLMLVAGNNLIIYTNAATEPYWNYNPSLLLSQNQSNLDTVIGDGNYDIGHVFGTGGGGLAGIGVVCASGIKAYGETGAYPPTGDAFWVDYAAHEIGHQLGACHTFNGTNSGCYGGRNASTAYEPGSGATIMGYAGVCGSDNLQAHSSPYFHSSSIEQIMGCITTGSAAAETVTSFSGNQPPVVIAGPAYTIPASTPFALTASGSDPDGDAVTWCWEERDIGPAIPLNGKDNGLSPLFRSFAPGASPSRTFPQISDILNDTVTPGERLPIVSRTMHFRVTARDNRPDGGMSASADAQVTVYAGDGPFRVTAPVKGASWSGSRKVTWKVAGTAGAPIKAANVNILLSTNGGESFSIVLATNAPNNGSATVAMPNIWTSSARIKVEAADNIFFDISHGDFSVTPASAEVARSPLSLTLTNGLAVLSWNGFVGSTFRVQYLNALGDTWTNCGPDIVATNVSIAARYPMGQGSARFYRVLRIK